MLCSYLPASVLADPNGRQRFQTLLKENLALIDLAKPLTKGTSPSISTRCHSSRDFNPKHGLMNLYHLPCADANRANRRRRRGEDDAEAGGRARRAAVGKLSNVRVSQFFNRCVSRKSIHTQKLITTICSALC